MLKKKSLRTPYLKFNQLTAFLSEYESVEKLAEYLRIVAENDELFASYFWWRDYYRVEVGEGFNDSALQLLDQI